MSRMDEAIRAAEDALATARSFPDDPRSQPMIRHLTRLLEDVEDIEADRT